MSGEPIVKLRAVVSGRVQGVFYRMFVLREAQALGLSGRVRNLLDGTVEVEAWGAHAKLEPFVGRLRKGPAGAIVSGVAADWEAEPAEYADFQIDYR